MSGGQIVPTIRERLLIDRRRRGETIAQAARRLGVSITRYSNWERGAVEAPVTSLIRLGDLTVAEQCLLKRRRAGMRQQDVANAMNRCRMWVRLMEQGREDPSELAAYWDL